MNKKIHLIGYAHLDPVWLWRWQEGFAEIKATFRSALDRMNEYPDYIFTCPCASYYHWIEENAPDMFEEITARVKEGRWCVIGGMWVQPDCNIPSGESFARHFLISQRYFKEKFGIVATTGYNADSFGHNASLPKLFKAAGIENYVMMRPDMNENPNIPEHAFWWGSNDGSRILTYRIANGYASYIHGKDAFKNEYEEDKARSSIDIFEKNNYSTMYFFGVGNHGGGPTIKSLNTLEKHRNAPDGERFIYSSPDIYLDEIRTIADLPEWNTEMQHHASLCYSACSEFKKNNRRTENRLTSAEKLASLADAFVGYKMPEERMDKAWQNVLFNQFHDIAAGCSIREAYEDARESHGESLNIAAEVKNAAVQRLSWAVDTSFNGKTTRDKTADWLFWGNEETGTPVIVFNPLSWDRTVLAKINRPVNKITDENGNLIPFQKTRASRTDATTGSKDIIFNANVPAMGWKLYWAFLGEPPETESCCESSNPKTPVIENENLKLEINPETGYISSLFDKTNNRKVFKEPAAVPVIIDVEHADTWGHGLFSFRDEVGRFNNAKIKIIESGPVRSVISVESYFETSILKQNFILYEGSNQIEVEVKLDWREKFKLLKLSFPLNITGEIKIACDVPFGHVDRPADGLEESGQMWLDVSADGYGTALLNDGKYSFNVLENDMRMTIVNSSMYADHYGQHLRDDQNEYLDQGIQYFKYTLLPHNGGWQDAGVVKEAIALNTEPIYITETYHKGPLPGTYKGIDVSAENIIITAIKPASDGNGTILRAYESAGKDTDCIIKLPFLDATVITNFTQNSIKTFRINNKTVSECNLTEDTGTVLLS